MIELLCSKSPQVLRLYASSMKLFFIVEFLTSGQKLHVHVRYGTDKTIFAYDFKPFMLFLKTSAICRVDIVEKFVAFVIQNGRCGAL